MMHWLNVQTVLLIVQRSISFFGALVILSGILLALFQYLRQYFQSTTETPATNINAIRLNLGRTLILGLEFIVAADLIGTTTAPDYYSVGILAIIVIIRTLLSFTLNREIMSLSKETSNN